MITGAQITAARASLGWSIQDLARHAGMEIADVQEVETSVILSNWQIKDLAAIQQALEDAGIDFIDSVGVELRPPGINSLGWNVTHRRNDDLKARAAASFREAEAEGGW